ncbi:hypothetical protein LSTR_LSTR016090 [Laodelphax striatellus]|uniref:Peptidase S1 domain-containing protein n=1 Tax=Laodelphax striatellus TaxID=195883 RepID=A0A482WMZ4_LAOST|nr:hypothetical protein LSTR_LSTR016090 [Laodelphax striatellus]
MIKDDVGASLVCDNFLAGLAVYSQECVNNKMASVFVSIPAYAKWIDSTINSSSVNSMSSLSVIMGTIISFSITKLLSR